MVLLPLTRSQVVKSWLLFGLIAIEDTLFQLVHLCQVVLTLQVSDGNKLIPHQTLTPRGKNSLLGSQKLARHATLLVV